MEVMLKTADFEQKVLKSDKPVLVDFFATWCGPCKMMGPVVEKLAEQFEGRAVVAKLDVDESSEIAERYRIMSVPSFLLFNQGEIVDTVVGAVSQKELASRIEQYI